jgi:hypothetical protein
LQPRGEFLDDLVLVIEVAIERWWGELRAFADRVGRQPLEPDLAQQFAGRGD